MIKVGYDYQIFTMQKYGGVSRLFFEISNLISKSKNFQVKLYAGLYQNKYLSNQSPAKVIGKQVSYPPKTYKLIRNFNSTFCRSMLNYDKPNIIHKTYYDESFHSPKSCKTVITVFDMIHEKFLYTSEYKEVIQSKSLAIKQADHVICISENTKNDLLNTLEINPENVTTIYLGNSMMARDSSPNSMINSPYILFVGQRGPDYKNFKNLLKAFGLSEKLKKDFKLVCFGSSDFLKDELDLINELELFDKVIFKSGGDLVLSNLYMNANAFVYPSLYEGFGIPPLEAMALKCPVVCSNVSSIPEVVGDAGHYFNPYQIEDIRKSIEEVVYSAELRKALILRGLERVKIFSWEKCARETELVYQKILQNS